VANKVSDIQVFERALDLIEWLQSGQRVTARMVAERYSVCLRTGHRIMRAAELALPVRCFGGEVGMGGRQMVWRGKNKPWE
jgi:predicted DNA-binding transcriptional regulator YafY